MPTDTISASTAGTGATTPSPTAPPVPTSTGEIAVGRVRGRAPWIHCATVATRPPYPPPPPRRERTCCDQQAFSITTGSFSTGQQRGDGGAVGLADAAHRDLVDHQQHPGHRGPAQLGAHGRAPLVLDRAGARLELHRCA